MPEGARRNSCCPNIRSTERSAGSSRFPGRRWRKAPRTFCDTSGIRARESAPVAAWHRWPEPYRAAWAPPASCGARRIEELHLRVEIDRKAGMSAHGFEAQAVQGSGSELFQGLEVLRCGVSLVLCQAVLG